MNIFESITSSFASVFANKMRSVLTMLGIIIGIGSVIMITSIGDGVKKQTMEQLSSLGLESIVITMNGRGTTKASDYLQLSDAELLKIPDNVTYVVPVFQIYGGSAALRNPNETRNLNVGGTNADYRQVQPLEMLYGRFLVETDVNNKSGVIVIDNILADKVFGREDVVGEKITINIWGGAKTYDIVGVTKTNNSSMYFDPNSTVFLPITTLMDYIGTDIVDAYYVMVADQSKASKTIEQMNTLLSNKHNNTDKYSIQNLKDTAGQIDEVLGQITMFVALVAAISLVVGGIGIMNIMLVTVTERTREIGIRKSIGATNGNILFQFLVEAMILTVIGGIIGILVGYGGSYLVSLVAPIVPAMSPVIITGTVLVSSLIGIIFGVYPANKAAALDPIEALRYE